VISPEEHDDRMKALGSKSYIFLFLTFIGIATAGFAALVALDRFLGHAIQFDISARPKLSTGGG
jgi:hypothetical protein